MPALPSLPTFASNDSSLTNLTELAYAVSFLMDDDIRPTWHFYNTAVFGPLTASTWTTYSFGSVAIDSDNCYSASGAAALIQTQGLYSVELCIPFESSASSVATYVAFLFTAGANNIHYTNGTTLRFGGRGGSATPTELADNPLCSSDLVPVCCYPGDTIAVQAWSNPGETIRFNNNASWETGRVVPNFTGYYVAMGT